MNLKFFTYFLAVLFLIPVFSFAADPSAKDKANEVYVDTHKYMPPALTNQKAGLPLETFDAAGWPPAGWSEYHTGVDALEKTADRAYSPDSAAIFNDITGVDSSWFVTSQITALDANSQLTFWQNQNFDSYYIYHGIWVSAASADPASGDFVEVAELGIGTEDVWEKVIVDLSGYAGQDIYIAFVYAGDYADEWYLDNVSVAPPATDDVGVIAVTTAPYPVVGGLVTVNATIKNFGLSEATGFNVGLSIDDGHSDSFVYSETLAPGTEDVVTFSAAWVPDSTGAAVISAWTELSSDSDPTNDTLDITYTVFTVSALNFEEDFTTYDLSPETIGWMGSSLVEFGTFVPSATDDGLWRSRAFGNVGSNSARVNLYGTSSNDGGWLITPPIDMTTGGPNSVLRFDAAMTPWTGTDSTGLNPEDTIHVVVSTDGVTWDRSNILITFDANSVLSPTGTPFEFDLSAWDGETGLQIGFLAIDMAGADDKLFYIDNVLVGVPPIPPITIAEARVDNDGDFLPDLSGQTVTVIGVVTTPNYGTGADYFIQDATAGINLYASSSVGVAALNVGDEVQVTGEIAIYNGKTEIMPADSGSVVVLSSGNELPEAQLVTIAEVGEEYEGELIRIENVWLVDPAQWPAAGANANVDFTDGADTLVIRVDKDTDIDGSPAPEGYFHLIGVGGQYDFLTPPDGGYQVQPRYTSDFISLDPSLIYADNFDAYTAGGQLVAQNSTNWETWSGGSGTSEDPYVSSAYASSDSNSVKIVGDNDLIAPLGSQTTGVYSVSWKTYIPNGKTGYFNVLAEFLPNTDTKGMRCYFTPGGVANFQFTTTTVVASFDYAYDAWQEVELVVDLDQDLAEFRFDGNVIYQWQWTRGGAAPLKLDAVDYWGRTSQPDEMYIDDFMYKTTDPLVLNSIDDELASLPSSFDLSQNYPNPFNPTTTIKYQLPEASDVRLVVYNVVGQVVRTLVNDRVNAGYHQVVWDGLSESGNRVASGVYIYHFVAGDFTKSMRMIMLK
jgi:hypothetical protein